MTQRLSEFEERNQKFTALIEGASGILGLCPEERTDSKRPIIAESRRRGYRGRPVGDDMITLVEDDGILRWHVGSPRSRLSMGRRNRRGGVLINGDVVISRRFDDLPHDKVNAALQSLDDRLSAPRGLRKLKDGKLIPAPPGPYSGKTLLIVHGTFSNNDNLVGEFTSTPDGKALLGKAETLYNQVLAFDHPTLAVSPIMNALDLARLFSDSSHSLDVVAHSRGGVVVRWWLEAFAASAGTRTRALLVGSPIAGTSLASGPRLRNSIDLMSNFSRAIEKLDSLPAWAEPLALVPVAFLRIFRSAFGVLNIPIADAAVALVPGLFGQAGIGNNGELRRLREGPSLHGVEYFAVRSNFEPADEGWKFWKYFRKTTLLDTLAGAVFDGDNDLVVDTDSMTDFGNPGLKAAGTWDFGTNPTVHHCNYFRQPETMAFMGKTFEIG